MQFFENHVHQEYIYLFVKIANTSLITVHTTLNLNRNPQEVEEEEEVVYHNNPGGQAIIPIPPTPAPTPPAPVSAGRARPARPATPRVNHNIKTEDITFS